MKPWVRQILAQSPICSLSYGAAIIPSVNFRSVFWPYGLLGRAVGKESDRLHLTSREVEKLIEATKDDRNEARDRCLLLLLFRHGFRVSEACRLKLDQVDTESRVLHVTRLKRGLSTTHPLRLDEIKAIKLWLQTRARMKPPGSVPSFFISEQRKPLHRSTVNLLLDKYSAPASLPFRAHPHMLRHGLRLRPGRPGRGYAAHSGLSRAPEDRAYGQVHGQ
jgi:type 1 fimbriae regulatory protein FimB